MLEDYEVKCVLVKMGHDPFKKAMTLSIDTSTCQPLNLWLFGTTNRLLGMRPL